MVKISSKIKKVLSLGFLSLGVFAIGNFALAGVDVGDSFAAGTGLAVADPRVIAANVIRIALAFLGIVAVGLMVYGGFLWMTAAGNMDRIDTAKKLLISAIIGLLIILSAFAIASFVLNRLLEATGVSTPGAGGPGGVIPPGGGGAGTPCDDNTLTPACEPSATICAPGLYCSPSSCTCRVGGGVGASCDSDDVTFGCQADGGMCMPGLFCDTGTCTCEEGSGVGESCDLDILAAGCQMSTSTCSNSLTCDPTACTCAEWPVIEWISPQGGFCEDEPNKACRNDADCTLTPASTCNRSLPNAAPGNIVTIGGRYFGDTAGQVYFWNGSDFSLAGVSPSTLNPDCDSNWSDDQIIVVVPAGAVSGPIRVVRADLLGDETNNNDQGPMVDDLRINSIRKPGLCKIDPDSAYLDDGVSYYGINFSSGVSSAKFGNYGSSIDGKNSNFVSALSGAAGVPSIQDGLTTTFVAGPAGDLSNYLRFTKKNEDARGPYIISFEPQSGAPGQYITVYGSGFGGSRGKNAVYFGDETGFEADYSFPDICADSVWSDNQVVVKVPSSAPDGNYPITMVIGGQTIDTSTLSPMNFRVNRSSPLLPSLCKISPSLGDVGVSVSVWGEYFDSFNTLSKIRFYNNKEVSGAAITFWDLDESVKTGVKPYRADTSVPSGAVTGLVKVVKGASALAGNGLSFRIGSCLEADDPNSACSPDICCPEGTYKSGRCVASANDCFMDVPSSVFEWDFNTGLGSATGDTGTTALSCAERSILLDLCDVSLCPNSPGECSPFDNVFSALTNVSDCAFDCAGVGSCTAGTCSFSPVLDRCVANGGVRCSLPVKVTDAYGAEVDAYCEEYQGLARRVIYIDGNSSCPNGWVMANVENNGSGVLVCVDPSSSCTPCGGDYSCFDEGGDPAVGVCAANQELCGGEAVCQTDGKCKKTSSDECQCCCRKANANQDCCAPLTCEGTCGSDRSTDTGTYGSCSGCRIEVGGVVDQTASDAACNCSNSFGKYCDVNADPNNDGTPEGVCGDCATLSTDALCTSHSGSCCVDATRSDICTGRRFGQDVGDLFSLVNSGGTAYCGYYSCENENTTCDATADIGPFDVDTKFFKKSSECSAKCSSPVLLGLSCAAKEENTCDASICASPAACLTESGGPWSPSDCGVCCCDPADDQCAAIGGSPNLRCQPDIAPCDGAGRGLCCGCSFNSDCVAGGSQPDTVGCGTDTCCRARPGVNAVSPLDGRTDACTNEEISIEFNQLMDAGSFNGNVIVVGQYATPCPAGTVYLASNLDSQNKNAFSQAAKIAYAKAKGFFKGIFAPEAVASDPPLLYMNYCAITGAVSSQNINPEDGPSILKFRPSQLLDPSRKYFVIVKGDPALDNSAGVKNYWGIGMNIPTGSVSGNPGRVDNDSPFNGIKYPSSYIWSFTTRPDDGGNKGVCDIEKAVIDPYSYLFSTNIQDPNEDDDTPTDKSFDTARDIDKKFVAKALSANGDVLFPATGYSWNWKWDVQDTSVVDLAGAGLFPVESAEQLIVAKTDVTDRRTFVTADIELTDSSLSSAGNGSQGTSSVYVFICNNPWPTFASDGTWAPWIDNPKGMDCLTGSCLDMRYELYYCRDSGADGTADDLPVLSEDVTRGSVSGSDVLKESYFFRQTPPTVEGASLELTPVPRGGEVELDWEEVRDPTGSQSVSKYKIYYGQKSGAPYASFKEVLAEDAPYNTGSPFIVKDLAKDKNYYFAITAVYGNGEESDYSNEEGVLPKDTLAPERPAEVLAESPRKNVPVNVGYLINPWNKTGNEKVGISISIEGDSSEVINHIDSFDLRWGTSPDSGYPNSVSVPARQALVEGAKAVVEENFASGTPYYFVVSATREDNTSAERAGAFKLTFPTNGGQPIIEEIEPSDSDPKTKKSSEIVNVGIPSGVMNVRWKPNTDDTVKYRLYWGTNHASYGQQIDVSGRDAAAGKDYKEATFNYSNTRGQFYITVTAIDAAGNESERADEIILIPSQSSYTFRNALTNVGFEEGAIGGVPTDWTQWNCCNGDAKVKIGITNATSFSGSRSLRFWQAAEVPYPGVCGSDLANRLSPAYDAYPGGWLPSWNGSQCDFPDSSPHCGSCVISAGQSIPWPWSNRVMWGKVTYNVTNLDWEVGEEYLIAFYYKGKLRSSTAPRFGYDLGWTTQCSPWDGSSCTYGSGWHQCSGNPSVCCHLPGQTDCYPSVTMTTIPEGDYNNGPYNGWYLYFQTFVYTEGLSKLYDGSGNNRNEVGMSIGYNNTQDGTEFFIDDFIVAQRVKK